MGPQSFDIPGRLPGLNEYTFANRRNKFAGNSMKRKQTSMIAAIIAAEGIEPYDEPVEVAISWHEKKPGNGRLRDIDNIRAGAKFVLDALVESGIIADDDPKHVRRIIDTVSYNEPSAHVEVTIQEYQPERTVTFLPVKGIE